MEVAVENLGVLLKRFNLAMIKQRSEIDSVKGIREHKLCTCQRPAPAGESDPASRHDCVSEAV